MQLRPDFLRTFPEAVEQFQKPNPFDFYGKVTFINVMTNMPMLTVEGRNYVDCSQDPRSYLILYKTGSGKYDYNGFDFPKEWYITMQILPAENKTDDPYHYEIRWGSY